MYVFPTPTNWSFTMAKSFQEIAKSGGILSVSEAHPSRLVESEPNAIYEKRQTVRVCSATDHSKYRNPPISVHFSFHWRNKLIPPLPVRACAIRIVRPVGLVQEACLLCSLSSHSLSADWNQNQFSQKLCLLYLSQSLALAIFHS